MEPVADRALARKAGWFRTHVVPYILVTKPNSVWLLVFTSVGGMIVAGGAAKPLEWWILALAAITAGCAGANTLTCYIDRDMDAVMERTRRRPLPGGRIRPPERALAWGLLLAGLSLVLSWLLNPLAFLWMFLGLFDNVVIYSLWAKRRTCINIILGSVSGGMPTLFGWSAARGDITWLPVLMGFLVVLWTPNHIWSLAIRYRDDYARAGVPMLPVVWGPRRSASATFACAAGTAALALYLGLVAGLGWAYELVVAIASAILLWATGSFAMKSSPESALRAFKVANSYLGIVLLAALAASIL
ncbi:MAG: heme o synthase [Candidatus Korarchaeota archaeon]|nr:heme o synthase [Candidatus Korarchaeota archaeon]